MKVAGRVGVPGDKSISHRALMLSALAGGTSRVEGILDSADVRSTAGVLRSLGVDVPEVAERVTVRGVGRRGLRAAASAVDCGNSGTTTRLMAGICAAHPFATRFTGDASLSRRPMRRIARPLEAMGARVELEGGDGLPMTVHGGSLRPIEWETEAASAQIKSAILLAALVAGVPATVREPARSRDHTERMLRARGVALCEEGTTVGISPVEELAALDQRVPGDPSSAAFFAGLAALADAGELELPNVCVNPTRAGFFLALGRMGVTVETERARDEGGEPVADLHVAPGRLRGIQVTASEIPSMIDELPLLACIATRAEGETVIAGAAELRVKESDRIAAVVAGLRAIGAEAEELPDGLRVVGSDRPLRGRVVTHGDHRLAMAFAILGAATGGAIEVDDPSCVSVSYPGFWSDLRRVCR